jgi:hypothetical protein
MSPQGGSGQQVPPTPGGDMPPSGGRYGRSDHPPPVNEMSPQGGSGQQVPPTPGDDTPPSGRGNGH